MPKAPRRTIAEVAAEHLREHDHPAVGYRDSLLLHEIAAAAGMPHNGRRTELNVLAALDRAPHLFEKRFYRTHRGPPARFYYLRPERTETQA